MEFIIVSIDKIIKVHQDMSGFSFMLTLTVPICYMAESDAEYLSYQVESLPVFSNKKPSMIYVPHHAMHFDFNGNEMTFSNCQNWKRNFFACDVNDINIQFSDCLHQLLHLKSEFEAIKVI